MSVIPKETISSELGSRFSFPENMKVEYDSFSGSLINEIVVKMVDKYEAKEYVANIIGEEYIIPTLGVWDKFEDIDFDALIANETEKEILSIMSKSMKTALDMALDDLLKDWK